MIDGLTTLFQAQTHCVKLRLIKIPQINLSEIIKNEIIVRLPRWLDFKKLSRDQIAIEQVHVKLKRRTTRFSFIEIATHPHSPVSIVEYVGRSRKNIFYERWINEAKLDITIDATEGEVINAIAKRRDVLALRLR